MFISFITWELPRSIKKLVNQEYTAGLYPETGRVVDFFFLFCGIFAMIYLLLLNNLQSVLAFLKTPGITSFYLIILVTIPLIILMGFFKRFFEKMGQHESLTVYFVQSFLDLMHTLFFVSVAVLAIPTVGYLISLL
jgi:O-antigen/teichoic acid export membrane protein